MRRFANVDLAIVSGMALKNTLLYCRTLVVLKDIGADVMAFIGKAQSKPFLFHLVMVRPRLCTSPFYPSTFRDWTTAGLPNLKQGFDSSYWCSFLMFSQLSRVHSSAYRGLGLLWWESEHGAHVTFWLREDA